MKTNFSLLFLLCSICVMFSSCEAIGTIFKAGVWVGVIGVALVIGLIVYLVGRKK